MCVCVCVCVCSGCVCVCVTSVCSSVYLYNVYLSKGNQYLYKLSFSRSP